MPASPPQEIATVVVNGRAITNWESVMVQLRIGEAYDIFEFTVAESLPPSPDFVQVMPTIGDLVQVQLGGIPVIWGPITLRQSGEDARRHSVQIVGKSLASQMSKSHVKSDDNNFDGLGIVEIARIVAGEVGVGVVEIGEIDETPFEKMSSAKGEPSWDFLEHLARERQVILSANELGNVVLIGKHPGTFNGDALTLPGNIERINVIWSNETVYSGYTAFGQNFGSDMSYGEAVAQLQSTVGGIDPNASNWVVPQEHADTPAEISKRAEFEKQLHDSTQLTVYATVQGWFRYSGDLWRPGNMYLVDAPGHLLNGVMLAAKSVTFTQDDENGTQATLELVKPEFINSTFLAP